jgi:glycosyltransferase involved in cell wall biosynthesis
MYKDDRITIVIPCLNEEAGVRKVLESLPDFVDEAIVVDNDSTDRTAEVASEYGAVVIAELSRGYGRAYKKGFAHATGDIIITLDGDHSYPVDALSYLLEAFRHSKVDFLSASRLPLLDRDAMGWKNLVGNRMLSLVMSALYLRWINDSQSGMWVFRRRALEQMNLTSDGMAFSEEIKIEAIRNRNIGFREIFINYSQRRGETKLQMWRDGFQNLWFLFKKRLVP